MKIRYRLLLTHLLLVVAVIALVGIAHDVTMRRRVRELHLADLQHSALLAAEALREIPEDAGDQPEGRTNLARMDALADRMGAATGNRVTIIAADGTVVGESGVPLDRLGELENHANRPEVVEARRSGRGTATRLSATVGKTLLYAAAQLPDGRTLRIATDVREIQAATASARKTTVATGLVAAALAAAVSLLVSAALARPIQGITSAARAMAAGDLARRTRVRTRDELGALARALDELAGSFATTIQDVRAEKERLAGILSGMVEGVLVVDGAGRITLVNPSLREILRLHGNVAGKTVLQTIRSAELHEAIGLVLDGKRPAARLMNLHGETERIMEVRFSMLRDTDDGRPGGLIAVFHDVTELHRLEQVRRDFVANASHELKTPVASILGATETLSAGALQDGQAGPRFLGTISRNAERLAALLDDLLDLSRLESRELSEPLRAVNPARSLAKAIAPFRDAAAEKRIQLEVEADPGAVEVPVRGDPALMERALTNLVQNAVRYTPEGGRVVLRAVKPREAPEGGTGERVETVRFEVEDTGIGIPSEALPRIFERFFRVDPARSRELGGTGLGLAIVKHAVESMGGAVSVESDPGRGSTFSFTLPVWKEGIARASGLR